MLSTLKRRVRPGMPLAKREDMECFQARILNIIWRATLSMAECGIFAAVVFCYLDHLAYNAWGGPGYGVINDTLIWL